MKLNTKELLDFFDNKKDDIRHDISSVIGVVGEDLGAALFKRYYEETFGKKVNISPFPVLSGTMKGPRLDRWIYVEQSKNKLEKRGPVAIPLSYWLPSVGALTNTAAGIIHMPFKKFLLYSVTSSIFWYSVVGLIVYSLGDKALEIGGGGTGNAYVFIIIGIWMLGILIFDYRERKTESISNVISPKQ